MVRGESVRISIQLQDDTTKEQSKSFEKDVRERIKDFGEGIQTALAPMGVTGGGSFMLIVEGSTGRDNIMKKGTEQSVLF